MANTFKVYSRIWIKRGDVNYLGYGRIELLRLIKKYGSISKASKVMGMSYKAAWDDLHQIKKLDGKPLIESSNGGKGGGGTTLTQEGDRAIEIFEELDGLKDGILEFFSDTSDLEELSQKVKDFRSHFEEFIQESKKSKK